MEHHVVRSTTIAPTMAPIYSQAVRVGDLVFVSGQPRIDMSTAVDPTTARGVPGGFEAEVRQAFANLDAVLRAAGRGLEHVVKVTMFVAEVNSCAPQYTNNFSGQALRVSSVGYDWHPREFGRRPKMSPAKTPAPSARATSHSTRNWTFLTNHGHVMVFLGHDPDARVRDIAAAVGITERAAQAILGELEADGYLTKVRVGRRNRYEIHPELAFRHPAEAGQPIGELLRIFA